MYSFFVMIGQQMFENIHNFQKNLIDVTIAFLGNLEALHAFWDDIKAHNAIFTD